MPNANLQQAKAFMTEAAIHRINNHIDHPDHWVIITPEILSAMDYKLPPIMHCPVMFIDFKGRNPLRIPRKTIFKQTVCISQSILDVCHESIIEGDLVMDNTVWGLNHVTPGHQTIDYKPMPTVLGNLFVSRTSFDQYRQRKHDLKITNNQTFVMWPSSRIRDIVVDAFHKTLPIELEPYLDYLGVDWEYNLKDSAYHVSGDLILYGPYHYTVPKGYQIDGDLIIYNDTGFILPRKENLKISGIIDIRGTL